jgi:hypothetical protein
VRESPARAVVRDPKRRIRHGVDLRNLRLQAFAAFPEIHFVLGIAKVDFADDGQQRDFEKDRVQPGPLDRDFDFARCGRRSTYVHEALVQMEQAQERDEIAFQEEPTTKLLEHAV